MQNYDVNFIIGIIKIKKSTFCCHIMPAALRMQDSRGAEKRVGKAI